MDRYIDVYKYVRIRTLTESDTAKKLRVFDYENQGKKGVDRVKRERERKKRECWTRDPRAAGVGKRENKTDR